MLLLTLTVEYYSRILNWHPLLHVKKTAVKPETLVDTLSAASVRASFEHQTPPPPPQAEYSQMPRPDPTAPAPLPSHRLVGFPLPSG